MSDEHDTSHADRLDVGDELTVVGTVSAPPGYTLGYWGIHPRWECGACPFDTLESEEAMAEHVQTAHPAPRERLPLPIKRPPLTGARVYPPTTRKYPPINPDVEAAQ